MTYEEEKQLRTILSENPFQIRPRVTAFLNTVTIEEPVKKQRTGTQNNSIHLWAEQIAKALTEQGYDLQAVVKKMPSIDVPMSKQYVKEMFFHPIIKASYGKTSTADLTTSEVDGLIDPVSKVLGELFGIETQFPADPNKLRYLMKTEAERGYDYPDTYTGQPNFDV